MKTCPRLFLVLVVASFVSWGFAATEGNDLSEYRTVDKAIKANFVPKAEVAAVPNHGFLGVSMAVDAKGWLAVAEVAANSPAAKVGMKVGDQVLTVDGKRVQDDAVFHDLLSRKAPGESVSLWLSRQGKSLDVTATVAPLSQPMLQGKQQAVLGVEVAKAKQGDGLAIQQIAEGSPAEKAALKVGEVILKVDNIGVGTPEKFRELLAAKKPGDTLTLTFGPADKTTEKKISLAAEIVSDKGGKSWDARPGGKGGNYWTKGTYRLGIILVDYPDVKHNPIITPKAWEDSMFSFAKYNKTNVTGQTVYGSMADHYLEMSYGKLKISGKAFEHIQVSKKRADYLNDKSKELLKEAMKLIAARDGKDAFKDLDGVFFVHSGGRVANAPRGSLYWPHRSSVQAEGKSWPYFICPEGGQNMANISVFCHEFGHMLSLPDLYARPENPGMEGVGIWSLMANQAGNGRPQHMDAWCKEKLGWIQPTVIDPAVKQKLILAPIEDSPKECFKIPLRRDGSEYLLLENRAKKGFDKSLPADGLLIWRVTGNRPILEESHGVSGPSGPGSFLTSVPYPSAANDAFTPYTIPSSQSKLGGGLPVHITNIRRLPDGKITFHIGYEYQ